MSKTPSVVIVEPNHTGHRLMYVRYIAEAAHRSQFAVTVVTSPEAIVSDEWLAHVRPIQQHVRVDAISQSQLESRVALLASDPDIARIVIPDGDRWLMSCWRIAIKSGKPLSLLVMRSGLQRPGSAASVLRWLSKRAAMLLIGALTPVRVVILISATAEPGEGRVLVEVADPVVLQTTDISQTLLGDSDQDHEWVAVLGAITRRKNIPIVADAISRIPGNRQVGLVVAGKIDDDARESVGQAIEDARESGVPTLVVDRHLTDAELDGLVYAADCVVVAHSNEGPSGLVGKAAAAGTPLALAGAESLRRDAETLGNLATWAPLNSELLAEGIAKALTVGRQKAVTGSTPDAFARALMPDLPEQAPGSSVSR